MCQQLYASQTRAYLQELCEGWQNCVCKEHPKLSMLCEAPDCFSGTGLGIRNGLILNNCSTSACLM